MIAGCIDFMVDFMLRQHRSSSDLCRSLAKHRVRGKHTVPRSASRFPDLVRRPIQNLVVNIRNDSTLCHVYQYIVCFTVVQMVHHSSYLRRLFALRRRRRSVTATDINCIGRTTHEAPDHRFSHVVISR